MCYAFFEENGKSKDINADKENQLQLDQFFHCCQLQPRRQSRRRRRLRALEKLSAWDSHLQTLQLNIGSRRNAREKNPAHVHPACPIRP